MSFPGLVRFQPGEQSQKGGPRVYIKRAGTGEPTIVFVHGFTCDSTDWDPLVERLAPHNSLVCCDLPAHGRTPGSAADCTIEAYGGAVTQMMHDLDLPPVVLIGHSLGCRVVLQAYVEAPERVIGIVLLDGSRTGSNDPHAPGSGIVRQITDEGYEHFLTAFFDDMFTASSDMDMRTATMARATLLPAEAGTALRANLAEWDALKMDRALESVQVPLMAVQSTMLNLSGARTSLSLGIPVPWLDLVRAHIPWARVEIVPGVGHFLQIEAADEVGSLIANFISNLTPFAST